MCPGPTRTAFFRTAQLNSDKLKDSKLLMSPEEVALYTVRALEKNRAIIIPGRRNRWFAFLPRLGSRWLNRTVSVAMTDEQLTLGLSPGARVARLERLRRKAEAGEKFNR